MSKRLQRVSELARTYNFTEAQVRWWVFNAGINGLAEGGAIVRIGRAVFIDCDKFDAWLDRLAKASAA